MRYVRYPSIELTIAIAFFSSVLVLELYLSSVGLHSSRMPYYEVYGQSLAKGHLWIQEAATPAQCAYDLSFYKGKCYPYWGIFPALIHVTMSFLSDRAVTLIACSIGLYFLLKTLNTLASRNRRPALERIGMPFYLFVAFGMSLPALCIAARVYEEAIAVGYAWGFAGLYLAIPLLLDEEDSHRNKWLHPLASSLCLALAGLSRLSWMGVAVLLNLWLVAKPAISKRSLLWRNTWPSLIPVILACALQLSLNYERFEDPFDFGATKSTYLAEMIASGKRAVTLGNVVVNAIYYLIAGMPPSQTPLRNDASNLNYPWISELFPTEDREFALGLFVLMPSLLLGFLPLLKWKREGKLKRLVPAVLTLPLALAPLSMPAQVHRYQLEICLPLLLLLIPPLLEQTEKLQKLVTLHWLSFLVPMPLTLVNSLWIVKTVCHTWGHC
jgi:hypothetical protein